jgi:hypothetical protein
VNDKRPSYCGDHQLDGMMNLVSKRCVQPGCDTLANKKTAVYKGHCMRCFVYNFPGEKAACNYKIKEQHVIDELNAAAIGLPEGVVPVCDKMVVNDCGNSSRRRPDWRVDLLTHCVIVEIDENQHVSYDSTCENKRLMQLFDDLGKRPLVVIRINPDSYRDANGKTVSSPFAYNRYGVPVISRETEWRTRMDALISAVRGHVKNSILHGPPSRELTVEQLFFDVQV